MVLEMGLTKEQVKLLMYALNLAITEAEKLYWTNQRGSREAVHQSQKMVDLATLRNKCQEEYDKMK